MAALDDWAGCLPDDGDQARQSWLVGVAQRVDPDSTELRRRLHNPAVWKDRAALTELSDVALVGKASVQVLLVIGERLRFAGADAVPFLTKVQLEHPGDFWANFALGEAIYQMNPRAAVRYYQAALAIRPSAAVVYNNLGRALAYDGRMDEAIPHFKQAIALDYTLAHAHSNLGLALRAKGRNVEALQHFEQAVRLGPQHAAAHADLGIGLVGAERWDEAGVQFREALRLDHNCASAHAGLGHVLMHDKLADEAIGHYREALRIGTKHLFDLINLGEALMEVGSVDEAGELFREALELDSMCVQAHVGFGYVMKSKGRLAESIEHLERALRIDPKVAGAHIYLGDILEKTGRLTEALDHLRQAAALDPKNARLQFNLAFALAFNGREKEAIVEFERVVHINPKLAKAHLELCKALLEEGRFGAAREAISQCLSLYSPTDGRRNVLLESVQRCDHFLALEELLPAIIQGERRPVDPAETLEFAELCRLKKQYTAAARLFADAFARTPLLTERPGISYRYHAACAAVLASSGRGAAGEAGMLERERQRWREHARTWLEAELAYRRKELEHGNLKERMLVRKTLVRWHIDSDLAGVRDEAALASLSETERKSWQKLWADVGALTVRDGGALLAEARACVDRREWAKAADRYAELLYTTVPDSEPWFEFAAAQLLAGDRDSYRQTCEQMLADKKMRAFLVARACTLAPGSIPDVLAASAKASYELKINGAAYWSLTESGGLSVRTNSAKDALVSLQKSLDAEKKPGAAVLNWLWLALAHQKLENPDEARAWLKKASAWLDGVGNNLPASSEQLLGLHRHNWLEAQVLRREAEALLVPAAENPRKK